MKIPFFNTILFTLILLSNSSSSKAYSNTANNGIHNSAIEDIMGPDFTNCPEDDFIIMDDDCDNTFTLTAPTIDDPDGANADGVLVVYETNMEMGEEVFSYTPGQPIDFSYSGIGTLIIEWMAVDGLGNFSSCITTIVLDDDTAPFYSEDPPADFSVNVDDNCSGIFQLEHPVPADNCGLLLAIVIITYPDGSTEEEDIQSGVTVDYSIPFLGVVEFDWFMRDLNGNDTHAFTNISIEDDTAPDLTDDPPANDLVEVGDNCTGTFELTHPIPVDNCGFTFTKVIITYPDGSTEEQEIQPEVPVEYSYQGLGTIEFDWFLRDVSGNDTHFFTLITLVDNTEPNLVCGSASGSPISLDENCSIFIPNAQPTEVTDNCGTPTLEMSIFYPDGIMDIIPYDIGEVVNIEYSGPPGNINVTWIAEDQSGNAIVCINQYIIQDNTAPLWEVSTTTITGECGVDDVEALRDQALSNLIAVDNCSSAINYTLVSDEPLIGPNGCLDEGEFIYSYTAMDEAENTSTEGTVIVLLEDSTPPNISGIPNDFLILCGETLPPPPNTVSIDDCAGDLTSDIVMTESMTVGSCELGEAAITYTYTWESMDQCGNVGTASWNLVVENSESISLGDDIVGCQGSSYFLSPSGMSGTYEWSTGETTEIIEISESGVYAVTVTSENGCCAEDEVVVSIQAPPAAVATGNTITCEDLEVQIFGDSDASGASYSWSGPNGFSSNEQDPIVNQEGVYTLVVTSINGCTSSTTAIVDANADVPDLMAEGGSIDCISTSTELSASSSFEGTYDWAGPDGYMSSGQNPTVEAPGSYTVTFTAENGCIATIQVEVENNISTPQIEGEDDVINCTTTEVILSLEGDEDLQYEWSGPDGFTSSDQNPTVDLPGTYEVIATDMNGCNATAEVVIIDDTAVPNLEAMGGILTCEQNFVEIAATSTTENVVFEWSGPNDFNATSASVIIGVAGEYTVVVTAENTCTNSTTVQVEADEDLPSISASGGTIDCNNSNVQLMSETDAEGATYLWTGPGGFSSTDPNPVAELPGTYILQVGSSNGCEAQTEIVVNEDIAPPTLIISAPIIGCNDEEVVIEVETDVESTFTWVGPMDYSSTDQNPTIELPGEYTVMVTGGNGCTTSETVTIELDESLPDAELTIGEIDCDNNSIEISAQFENDEYEVEWRKDDEVISDEGSVIISEAGVYALIVTGPNGCEIDFMYTLEEDFQDLDANITTTDATSSSAGTATLVILNSVLPVTVLWDNGEMGLEAIDLSVGIHTVSVTDIFGCTYTYEFEIEMSTSIQEIKEVVDWQVYPTLASSSINVKARFSESQKSNILIFDIYGKTVFSENLPETLMVDARMDVSDLNSGAYILILNTPAGRISERFIKMD